MAEKLEHRRSRSVDQNEFALLCELKRNLEILFSHPLQYFSARIRILVNIDLSIYQQLEALVCKTENTIDTRPSQAAQPDTSINASEQAGFEYIRLKPESASAEKRNSMDPQENSRIRFQDTSPASTR